MEQEFGRVKISNPRSAIREPNGDIIVKITLSEDGGEPEEAMYGVVEGDDAPAAQWLRELMASGQLPVVDATPEYMNARFWEDVRTRRNDLLQESDQVTERPDVWERLSETRKQAWREYRQALRDIPQTHTEPLEINWPTHPDEQEIQDRYLIPKLTIVDRIIAAGKIEEALAVLNADPITRLRWDAATEIYDDDPMALGLIQQLGLDPEVILAPQ